MRRRFAPEDGSLVFALLGVLIITSLVVTLFILTMTTVRETRSDRDYQAAILSADAGLQQALTQISYLSDASTGYLEGSGTVDDATYTWTADRNGSEWEVVAQATDGEATRTVEAVITRHSRFIAGAFADLAFVMTGDNGADSYRSSTGEADTDNGAVGSNGSVDLEGNAFADRVLLYGTEASCSGEGCNDAEIIGSDVPFDMDAVAEDVADEAEANCGGGYVGWQASTSPPLEGGNTYCFANMVFDEDTTLVDASLSAPVVVYLTGDLTVANHVEVNCGGCSGMTGTLPVARALQIYSTGTTVSVGNHVLFAAAVAAPNASCHGLTSNAQAEIYGAMICSDMSNQGGWSFHFDEDLLGLGNGSWGITEWREEVGGSTSF